MQGTHLQLSPFGNEVHLVKISKERHLALFFTLLDAVLLLAKSFRHHFTHDLVYYGIDPTTKCTVYVGPDNTFYTFNHPPPFTKADLKSKWEPHDAADGL